MRLMRIALVGPVAQPIPPPRSGSVESVTALLADGLVSQGHDVTLFATGSSVTSAKLHATFPLGYHEDTDLWPWELCELWNLSAAVERAGDFDIIHYQAEYAPTSLAFTRISSTPVVVTLHHAPTPPEVALWSRYPEAPFVAISDVQERLLSGLNVVETIHHAVDTDSYVPHPQPEDYLIFLGRFTEGKGVLQAIEVAHRSDLRLVLVAAENEYYAEVVAPLVDGTRVVYAGELGLTDKVRLLGRARALLYPLQSSEPFGLVIAEAMACGTPVAALRRGAVDEIVDDGVTGEVFDTLDDLVEGLPRVLALDRGGVRSRAAERFGPDRLVAAHVRVYSRLMARRRASRAPPEVSTSVQDLSGGSLLAVFAHPDDESLASGGLIAMCADSGIHVSLLCLTHGELGLGNGGDGLGDVRAGELRAAADVLGIRDVMLLDHEDGMLPWIDAGGLEADILDAISRFRPDVVVTFDEDGLYWHPDHITAHERTTSVVANLGASGPALWYVSLPEGAMRAVVEAAPEQAEDRAQILGVADPDAFGSMAPAPTLVVEIGLCAGRKLEALRCHRTQVEGGPLDRLAEEDAERCLGTEHYRRAEVGSRKDAFIERFGVPTAAADRAS
jgi:LmbE family N-acetylglucosaminyl deacetylase/glycosyltransferase involved in cell wall biosynthesis